MRLEQSKIEEIIRKAQEGLPYKRIAAETGVSTTAVTYWANKPYREKIKAKNKGISYKLYKEGKLWAQQNPEKYRAWFRKYQKNRYHSDPVFREKMLEANKKLMARKRAEGKTWTQTHMEEYKKYLREYSKRRRKATYS
jgi:hypothetical protein